MTSPSRPNTLIGLLNDIPADRTAIIVPEQNLRISYEHLRKQVDTVARALAAAGVKRGDRVASRFRTACRRSWRFSPPAIAGTAAPLNPAYKEEEFRFYLEDTNAKVLLLPRDGAEEARKAAGDSVPILVVDMDATGTVSLAGITPASHVDPPGLDDVALILHTSGSTGRPKRVPLSHANLSISAQQRRAQLRAHERRRLVVRDAAVSRARPRRVDAGHAVDWRHRGGARQVQPALLLARRTRPRRHVVLRGADTAPTAARARPAGRIQARPARRSCASSGRAARRSRRRSCTISSRLSARRCSRRTA